jgi:hypothetical protein
MKKCIFRYIHYFWNNRVGVIFALLSMILIHFMLRDMWKLFYAFDEWKILGTTYVNGLLGEIHLLTPLEIVSGKARILALLLANAASYFAPFSAFPFAASAYIFHFLNGALMYSIVKKMSKSKFLAFNAGIFFITGSVASQVFTWVAATYEQLFSVFFSLLAIRMYLSLPKKKSGLLSVISWIFVIIAYYFRETSIIVVVLLLWLYRVIQEKGKKGVIHTIKYHSVLLILFLGIGVSRLLTHLVIRGHPTFAQQLHPSIARIVFHLLYYPLTTFAHLFVPHDLLFRLSQLFYRLQYSHFSFAFPAGGQYVLKTFILAEYLSFIISVGLFLFIYFVLKPIKKFRVLLSFAVIYYVLQCIPLAFYDKDKGSAYFDLRYYYVFLPAGGIIYALLLDWAKGFTSKILHSSLLAGFIVFLVGSSFIYKQALVMRRDVTGAWVSTQRSKDAIEQFTNIRKDLPNKPIIFLSGNSEYNGMLRNYIPIEFNPGYALMVWYYKTGKIPGELIMEPYHFDQGEGYREIGNKAYGYFNNKEDLLNLFKNNSSLSLRQVIGFYYNGQTNILTDNTQEIRDFLQSNLNTIYK